MRYWLLTGATGLLGQYLLRDLLLRNENVCVLTRAAGSRSAHQRIESLFRRWEQELGRSLPRPVVLEGELTEPNFGLDESSQQWIRQHVEAVIHSAASLSFTEEPNGEPNRSNVEGTRTLLGMCRKLSIKRLCHVSTAYVVGRNRGRFWEDELEIGQTPSNAYEKSKIEAERMVRSADFLESLTVLRPSIIVGDSKTYFTSTFHGFYTPLQIAATMVKSGVLEVGVDVLDQLQLRAEDRKNFVPVDYVSEAAVRIILNPKSTGRTFHLVHPEPTPIIKALEAWAAVVFTAFEQPAGVPLAQKGRLTSTKTVEMFKTQLEVYRDYFRDDPDFDCSNTRAFTPGLKCPPMTIEMMTRLGEFAATTRFGMTALGDRAKTVQAAPWAQTLSRWNAAIPSDAATAHLVVEVLGPGGGKWLVKNQHARPGTSTAVRLSGETWQAIVAGQMAPEHALATGRVWIHSRERTDFDWAGTLTRIIRSGASEPAAASVSS